MSQHAAEATDHLASSSDTLSALPPPLPELSGTVTIPRNSSRDDQSNLVISKIDKIKTSMIEALYGEGDSLSIPYRSRKTPQRADGALRFPGSSVQEAVKFSRMMRIMELVRNALVTGQTISKRNIYYQDTNLFKNQGNVDQLVDDLAFTLGVGRDALSVVAASKGLIAGPLRLELKDKSIVSCSADLNENHAIPLVAKVHRIDFGETRWILVVEKEATFRTLAASQYWKHSVHGQGIIVTGKGYADLATLQFLNLIHSVCPALPILCVVDCDPHGVDIMRTYKYGSQGLRHEKNATVPGLQWLGVKVDDVLGHITELPEEDSSQSSAGGQSSQSSADYFGSQGSESYPMPSSEATIRRRPRQSSARDVTDSLMPLTENDRKTAQRIFKVMADGDREPDHEETEQLRELQVMLMLNMKAEIQAIDHMGDLSGWLDEKMGIV